MWHFADGSTSARPYLGGAAAACAKDAFDPFTQPEVVGCSLYSDTDGGAAVHLDLRQGEGGGGGAALLEAAWLAVAKLLCGEEQAVLAVPIYAYAMHTPCVYNMYTMQAVLVVPNAQLVLRTLLLVLPELQPAGPCPCPCPGPCPCPCPGPGPCPCP
jgi:hypothetical protein